MRHHFILFLVMSLALAGCAKLTHLEQLLTIKAYSDNKDLQEACIKKQDENFEKLLLVVRDGKIEEYKTKKSFLKAFGDPVFMRKVTEEDGKAYELWLYRYARKFFGSEKVYLYFDAKGGLYDWEYSVPRKTKEKKLESRGEKE